LLHRSCGDLLLGEEFLRRAIAQSVVVTDDIVRVFVVTQGRLEGLEPGLDTA
jgi:hypothetical protein